ncbi:helix-turn-helix domain-containing protein [Pseudonocardia acaciae]|uniref:helix-turn-helix domain-containing protein n=1 Tax=Pseudonocardia acaciae TaxID=551276 RepID=UPI00048E4B3B|nr:helix-turn-helix domain-containing protein [Pseudonocardia acaciae]
MAERVGLAHLAADLWFVGHNSRATVGERIVTVLAVLNTTAPQEMPALDIARTSGLPSGAVESTLRRLVELGWVDCR